MRPFKTSIPAEVSSATASSGAHQPEGKTSQPCSVMTDPKRAAPETIRDAVAVPGAARKCQQQQDGGNANRKHRDANTSGLGAQADANVKALK